jgi:hypothetical protein
MYQKIQNEQFQNDYNLQTWCLVESNKLIRSVVRRSESSRSGNFFSCLVQVLLFGQAADSFINHLNLFVMTKQQANIVYDSYNDVTWDFSGFFEKLADYYNGNVQEMSEQLIACIEVKNSALNLLTVRELLNGVQHEV